MPVHIKGKVSAYSDSVNAGTILGEDSNVYIFARKDWGAHEEPEIAMVVSFIADLDRARLIQRAANQGRR